MNDWLVSYNGYIRRVHKLKNRCSKYISFSIFADMKKQRLALFASGNGSNAEQIIEYFRDYKNIEVALVLTNKKSAGVLDRTKDADVAQLVINNREANDGGFLISLMRDYTIDYIVLCGYLRMIPQELIAAYPAQIINIHPALLPDYGGAGMYGMRVHQAVKNNRDLKSGITIHLVNEAYDKGKILAQHKTSISTDDTVETIQRKVQTLEHKWFSSEIERYIKSEEDA